MEISTAVVQVLGKYYYLALDSPHFQGECSRHCELACYDKDFCNLCCKLKEDTNKMYQVWRVNNG